MYELKLKDGATLAFCENGFCGNLKTNKIKDTFLERKFHKESIYMVRVLAKSCIFEKLSKIDFCH